jgi:hypothetical protein
VKLVERPTRRRAKRRRRRAWTTKRMCKKTHRQNATRPEGK